MRLSEIQTITATAKVQVGTGTFGIEFYPAKLTRKGLNALTEKAREASRKAAAGEELAPDDTESTARLLVELLHSWELTDDKEKPLPITVKCLVDECRYFLMNRIWLAVQEGMNPNSNGAVALSSG